MSPKRRELAREQLLMRTALSSKHMARSGLWRGQDALRSAIASRGDLPQGALSTRKHLGMVDWCGFHGENEQKVPWPIAHHHVFHRFRASGSTATKPTTAKCVPVIHHINVEKSSMKNKGQNGQFPW
jgi:hypothetical protein